MSYLGSSYQPGSENQSIFVSTQQNEYQNTGNGYQNAATGNGYGYGYDIQTNNSQKNVTGEVQPLVQKKAEKPEPKNIFARVCTFFFSDADDSYVDQLLASNFLMRAVKFLPALLITFGIELGNSAVLGNNQAVLERHFTLVIFIPVISAIAGNIGLQTSSSVTAYINLRIAANEQVRTMFLLVKYTSHCVCQVILLATLMGILASFWNHVSCQYSYGLIVFCGSFLNMTVASVAGVMTPILLNKAGYDPSSGAGPFETALQDVIGAVFFVWFAKEILASGMEHDCFLDSSEGKME